MIQKPKGTKDIFGPDIKIYQLVFDVFESLAKSYNIQKIITPTFESYELFQKSNGEDSDIVSKEIYKFEDYNNRLLALKPEGTASIGRAILENKLLNNSKFNKLYYIDSMYRYEKPQKGRMRQFYQIGVEFIDENLNSNLIIDAIVLAKTFLEKLSISDFEININNIGTIQEREKYINVLKKYFSNHKESLSLISQKRIETNPLRILDDKTDSKLDIVKNAPKISEFLSQESKDKFNSILAILDDLNISYVVNEQLVRGLDYYSSTVFEFISSSSALGTKSTIIGGGCYLNLMNNNDENKINGIGFAIGVERVFEILKHNLLSKFDAQEKIDVFFILENEEQYHQARKTIYELRSNDIVVEYNLKKRKFKKILDDAQKMKSQLIVFQELNQHNTNKWTIKTNNVNINVDINDLVKKIKKSLK